MSMEECTLEVWFDRILDSGVMCHWLEGKSLPYFFQDDVGASQLAPEMEQ